MIETKESIIEKLKKLARETTWTDFEEDGFYDFDDCTGKAYDCGLTDGKIRLARDLLDEMGIDYKEETNGG